MTGPPETFACRCVECARCWLMGAVRAGPRHEYWNHGETILPYTCPYCGAAKDPNYRPGSVEATLLDVYTTFADEESDGPAKTPNRSKRTDP